MDKTISHRPFVWGSWFKITHPPKSGKNVSIPIYSLREYVVRIRNICLKYFIIFIEFIGITLVKII